MSDINTPEEYSQEIYIKVRTGFVAQGLSLNSWCKLNGHHIQNVRDAFFGRWQGQKAKDLINKVLAASKSSKS